ncbi:hypothetical protein ACEPAI_5935 [Sanghuangporus weigelae]
MSSPDSSQDNLFSTLLKPGSSLHPTFLRVLDATFATLLAIFISLLYLLSGNVHIIFLIGIELCLWASVKWFVNELKRAQDQQIRQSEPTSDAETRKMQ